MRTFKVLSIAGSDSSSGAGIQADLKTFGNLGCYGVNVITAVTAQNTKGVQSIYELPISIISEQLNSIFEDIVPDAIKIGMLFSEEIINFLSAFLANNAQNIPIVLDPVMISQSGHLLCKNNITENIINKLFKFITILTPNINEAANILNISEDEISYINMKEVCQKILDKGECKAIFLKGGHLNGLYSIDTYLDKDGLFKQFKHKRIHTKNNHGTGCTLSSAIASYLAIGHSTNEACKLAKNYLYNLIKKSEGYDIGSNFGPLNHFYKF